MKCKHFLPKEDEMWTFPSVHPLPTPPPPPSRASKWGHRRHSHARITVILDLKMHTQCEMAALLLHLETMFENGNFGHWASVLGPHGGPDAPVKQSTRHFSWMIILLNFVIKIADYVFSRRGNTHFPFETPCQSLPPPPPPSGVVLGTNILFFTCEKYRNTMWFVRRTTSGSRIWTKKYLVLARAHAWAP